MAETLDAFVHFFGDLVTRHRLFVYLIFIKKKLERFNFLHFMAISCHVFPSAGRQNSAYLLAPVAGQVNFSTA